MSRSRDRQTAMSSRASKGMPRASESSARPRSEVPWRTSHRIAAGLDFAWPRRRQGNQPAGPAIGAKRPVGIPPRPRARRPGQRRNRTADCGLLAADLEDRQHRYDRTIAICLPAAPRQGDGAGIAARGRLVQDRRSQRLPPRLPRSRSRRRSADIARSAAFLGWNFWDCCWIVRSCSSSGTAIATVCAHRKATPISYCGIFTICCFTPTAPRADKPIRWADFTPIPISWRPCPRCGRHGRDEPIDLNGVAAASAPSPFAAASR